MNKKYRPIAIALCGISLSLLVITFAWQPWQKYEVIQKINLKSDLYLEITAARSWEVTRPIECRLVKTNILKDTSFIGSVASDTDLSTLEFEILKSTDDGMLALYEKQTPAKILFIYEPATGRIWTGYTAGDSDDLFEKLKQKFPEKHLVRSDMTNEGNI